MKIEYKTNFAGYICLMRAIQSLLKDKKLNLTEFGAYLLFVMQADYDKRHKHYGVIIRDDYELAAEFGYNYTTIHKHRRVLIRKGFLVKKDGYTYIPNLYLFEFGRVKQLVKLPFVSLQYIFARAQIPVEKIEEVLAKVQEMQAKNDPRSKISSKDSFTFSKDLGKEMDYEEIDKGIEKQRMES